MRAPAAGLLVLLLAPHALGQIGGSTTASGDCPENLSACGLTSYAQTTIRVGPVMVVVTLQVDDGNDELEVNATARPGEAGEITFRVEGANASANATVQVALRVDAANTTLEWTGPTEASFAFDPRGGPEDRVFRFRVPADAEPGASSIPFAVTADDKTAQGGVGIEILPVEERQAPAPALAALAGVALAALALRRRA